MLNKECPYFKYCANSQNMCTCRVTVCIITLCAYAEWWYVSLHYVRIITLCAYAEWWCVSLHYMHMQSDSVHHYIMCTCRVTVWIIILVIILPPMLNRQKLYMKCMKSEHAAQKYAGNFHKIWKQLTFYNALLWGNM